MRNGWEAGTEIVLTVVKCTQRAIGEFMDRRGLDCIYGDRSDGWVVQRRWQVALVHEDGKLTEVLASTGLVGPLLSRSNRG